MPSSSADDRASRRLPDRRTELRYDGRLAATFTYTPSAGGTRAVSCLVTSISASAIVIAAPLHGQPGEHLWVEIEGFGLIRCEIEQIREDGFICFNRLKEDARRRLATWISWLRRRGGRIAGDNREYMRTRPRDARTTITLADGDTFQAMLSDVSRSGAAVSIERALEVGDAVAVGKVPARVARVFTGGFAVAFDQVLDAAEADRLVAGYEVGVRPNSKAV